MLERTDRALPDNEVFAERTRAALARSGTLAVLMTGPPGAGKTQVICETLHRLPCGTHAAAIVAHSAADRDVSRLSYDCPLCMAIDVTLPEARDIARAVGQLDLHAIDLLFIEALGGVSGVPRLGQDHTVVCLSVSGGDDKAAEFARVLGGSALLLLTQTDLRHHIPFNQAKLVSDARAANPRLECIEISCPQGTGLEDWMRWLTPRWQQKRGAAKPYEELLSSEWFFG